MQQTGKMARRQLVLLLSGMLVCSLVALGVQAARYKPDCSNTFTAQGASFSTFKSVCGQISDEKLFENALGMDELNKLEIVESCACALLNHELAWASLMNLEAEVLYKAIENFVRFSTSENTEISALRSRTGFDMFNGPDGERRYFWERLDFILKPEPGEHDKDEHIAKLVLKEFANQYYDPATLNLKYSLESKQEPPQKLRLLVSGVCNNIVRKFALQFLPLFDRLSKLAENDQLFFSLTAYNENLHKLRTNTRICLYLMNNGQLLSNF